MSIAYVGNIGHANDKVAGSTIQMTVANGGASVGDEVFVLVAYDNNNGTSTGGPEMGRGTVADSKGNTWTEVSSGEDAGTDNRSFLGCYKSRLTTALSNGDTITFTYVSSRTASAITAERFTATRPLRLHKIVGARPRAQTGVPAISLDLEHNHDGKQVLWIAGCALESANGLSFTQDADYSAFTGDGTTGSTDGTNQSIRGGYRISTGVSSDTYDADIGDATSRDMTQFFCAFVEVADTLSLPTLTGGEGFRYLQCVGWGRSRGDAGATTLAGLLDGVPVGTLVVAEVGWDASNDITDTGPDDNQVSFVDTAGNTWTFLAGAQNAAGGGVGRYAALYYTIVTNAISPGDTLTATYSAESNVCRNWTAHAFAVEGGAVTMEARAHTLTDAADPGSVALSSMTSRPVPYLLLHALCGDGPDSDQYTWDADYTRLVGVGQIESSLSRFKHLRGGYRIAAVTADTVDVTSDTADRTYAQTLVALWTTAVTATFQQQAVVI